LFTDAGYSDSEDKDTATHLEQAENLLISVRSIQLSDDDQEVDVSYEKAESRRLLNENIVLRRDAEMAGKFPAKSVLGSLEPFLIDIANLPDKAPAKDLRQIRDRVQKTEIVAELRGYE
jgi:flagellar biosynthesis/type III secretory pathway ATPase